MALQYADDTAIISNANEETLISLKLILRMFTAVSGLHINYDKSVWIPINIGDDQRRTIDVILGCKRSEFPTVYLGMPLTVKRPSRALYMPLIQRIEKRLEGWKGRMISRGGRLQLVNSVLSAIPIYFMACFHLPQWVIKRIDKVRRVFLWGKNETNGSSVSLLNWDLVCVPKRWGGMGVANLQLRNLSLLLRWWWRLYNQPSALWTEVIINLKQIGRVRDGPKIWFGSGSFFWKSLQHFRPLFSWCTTWQVGSGISISYWMDAWNGPPIATANRSIEQPYLHLSLADVTNYMGNVTGALQTLTVPVEDRIVWRWEGNGLYSAKSAYEALTSGGMICWRFNFTWRFKVPPTVKIFLYLLLKNRLLTHEMMHRRGFNCEPICTMCDCRVVESAMHLFFNCAHARRVWATVNGMMGVRIMHTNQTVRQTFETSRAAAVGRGLAKQTWNVFFAAACWGIWKHRNSWCFEGKRPNHRNVAEHVILEGRMWNGFC